ncbi:MAG: Fe-S protein assembly chaperone HscA [Myxococcota bacterium]
MAGGLLQISEPGAARGPSACAGRVVGIDLGTTYSLVATVRGGKPECLRDEDGRALLPSVVRYSDGEDVRVGWEARALAPTAPLDTIASVKRFMGRGFEDAELRTRAGTYRFADAEGQASAEFISARARGAGASEARSARSARAPDGPPQRIVRFAAGGREVTPIEVSAEILRVLRRRAEEQLGGPLDGAVITVPAYFDDAQRQATKDAGRLAGLDVLRLLNEPTAAALAYGLDKKSRGCFAIYDLGGGTFDVSILDLEDGVFQVKATSGDTALGGDDVDRAVAAFLLGEPSDDARVWRQALADARAAKERLTLAESTEAGGTIVTRAQLEELAAPTIERTKGPCLRALRDAGIDAAALDGVVLVGGQTRMPAVRRFVASIFGREPLADLDPDEVVALGAAVQADMLAGAGPRDDVLLLDVIPLSLGLETIGGVVEKILPRNSTIPIAARQVFTTFADRQTGMDVHVLQGERELVDQCRSLARFTLRGIPPLPAGMGRVEIVFQVDADGLLTVSAREQTTGVEQKIEVKPTYGLTDAEVERMLLDSYEHAEADVRERMLREERVEAEQILGATLLALAGEHAPLLQAGEREAIERAASALREAARGIDHAKIRELRDTLDRTAAPWAQRRMDAAITRAIAGKHVDEALR